MGDRVFRINVEYRQPTHEELVRIFFRVFVKSGSEFRPIPTCASVPLHNRELEVALIKCEDKLTVQEALDWIDRSGYRPALYEELLAFVPTYRSQGLTEDVHAIGSVTSGLRDTIYASARIGLHREDGEPGENLILGWYGYLSPNMKRFSSDEHFLVVRN